MKAWRNGFRDVTQQAMIEKCATITVKIFGVIDVKIGSAFLAGAR